MHEEQISDVNVWQQVLSVLADRYFYGRWTSSVVNLVFYNVLSGEGSTLYGTEGPLFYLWNAFNNFNFSVPLALVSPTLLYIGKRDYYSLPRKPDRGYQRLLVAVWPLFLWLGFMSLQAHKEERSVHEATFFVRMSSTESVLLSIIISFRCMIEENVQCILPVLDSL